MLITRAGSSVVAAARSSGSNRTVRKNGPFRLMSITLSQPDSGNSSSGAPQAAPALLTRMSSFSSRSRKSAQKRSTPSTDARSLGSEMHSP